MDLRRLYLGTAGEGETPGLRRELPAKGDGKRALMLPKRALGWVVQKQGQGSFTKGTEKG